MTGSHFETFVNSIQNVYNPPGQSDSKYEPNYSEVYSTIFSNINLLMNTSANLLSNSLAVFTLPAYTLPHMAILNAISNIFEKQKADSNQTTNTQDSNRINLDELLNQLEKCLQLGDERQIEVASNIYCDLCHFYTNNLCQINKPKRGLLVLRKAIEKVQTDPNNNNKIRSNQLTTIHSDLMQLSLAAKNFTLALELMTHEILDINKPQNLSFDPKYFLSYFYYTACVHSAMKQYDSALFYFEQALTIPASALSQIMIEAYKKFLLISLISKGKLPMLPKYTSRIVLNQIKPQCSFYHELASAFMNYDQDKLNSTCQKYHDVFSQDGNLGLIKQLQLAFHKKNIQKLTKTFITLSLTDMANKVKLASVKDAENIMLNMIKDGEIFATINQKDGMVSFHENPEKYDNPLIMETINQKMFECIDIDSSIREMDKEITTHPHYIQKCHGSSASLVDDPSEHLLQSNF